MLFPKESKPVHSMIYTFKGQVDDSTIYAARLQDRSVEFRTGKQGPFIISASFWDKDSIPAVYLADKETRRAHNYKEHLLDFYSFDDNLLQLLQTFVRINVPALRKKFVCSPETRNATIEEKVKLVEIRNAEPAWKKLEAFEQKLRAVAHPPPALKTRSDGSGFVEISKQNPLWLKNALYSTFVEPMWRGTVYYGPDSWWMVNSDVEEYMEMQKLAEKEKEQRENLMGRLYNSFTLLLLSE